MPVPLYRGPPADACITIALEPFVAVYDRRSGATHLLAEPAPQLLDMLAAGPLTLADLRVRLAAAFDLPDVSDAALHERLRELVEAGLVAVA